MKKIILLVIVILLFTGCSNKVEIDEKNDKESVGLANPIVAYDSLDEVNKKIGCHLANPYLDLVDNLSFSTINDEIGQVTFDYLDHTWTLRGACIVDSDISGIYDNNNAFVSMQDSTVYLSDYYIERKFVDNQQYTLVLDNASIIDESSFSEVSFNIMDAIVDACDPNNIAGKYMDSNSQRAVMIVDRVEEYYDIVVSWGEGANSYKEWTMSGHVEDNKLIYEGENIVEYESDSNGNTTVINETASNNLGYFEIEDGKLFWYGASQESCKECIFEKVVIKY